MQYLESAEYASFGLSADTNDALVLAASAMIDGFCRRPSLAITQYLERLQFARECNTVQLSNTPLAAATGATSALVSVRVRLRRPRQEVCHPLVADAGVFGVPGRWIDLDVSAIDATTDGVLCFVPNFLTLPFDEAEVKYTAGFATVPDAVKIACAQVVRNAQAMPALSVKRQVIDSMQMEYFSSALLDTEVQRMLQPYVSQRVG
jgi:hypothetical protein